VAEEIAGGGLSAGTGPQAVLARVFGVGKTSIHPWISAIGSADLAGQILRELLCWSGHGSVDAQWVTISGQGYVGRWAVDAGSGFALRSRLYSRLDMVSWPLLLLRVTARYGLPTRIQCDGSQALAAAREAGCSGVRSSGGPFHKLQNLMTRVRTHLHDPTRFTRCGRLAKRMVTHTSVRSRQAAAKRLQTLAAADVSAYLEGPIVTPWRKLTVSLTTTASERFNRPIEKCLSGRSGVPSEARAKVV
jgi:hypothetical protein